MTDAQYYLNPRRNPNRLVQTFSLDPGTAAELREAQETINGLGEIGFSRSIILRVAIENLGWTLRNAQQSSNHAALQALRNRAWQHSSKTSSKGTAQ